jgi:hypothetical protein
MENHVETKKMALQQDSMDTNKTISESDFINFKQISIYCDFVKHFHNQDEDYNHINNQNKKKPF